MSIESGHFENLVNMRFLNLKSNQIEQIDEYAFRLESLNSLDLGGNSLTSFLIKKVIGKETILSFELNNIIDMIENSSIY